MVVEFSKWMFSWRFLRRCSCSFKVAKAFGMAGISKLGAKDGGEMNDVQKDTEGMYGLIVPLRKVLVSLQSTSFHPWLRLRALAPFVPFSCPSRPADAMLVPPLLDLFKAARRPSHEKSSGSRAGDDSSDDEFGQVSMTFG